jgi:hypothetical protein
MVIKANKHPAPKTRFEKRKARKKLLTGIGSIIGLLFVVSASYIIINNVNKHKTDLAATKPAVQTNDRHVQSSKKTNNNGKNSTNNNSGNSELSSSTYILPDSDKKVLSEEDIATLSKQQLRLARNEIYARHGYVFKSADLQQYFSSKSWYTPDPSYNGSLNDIETKNVMYLKEKEDQM